MPQYLRRRFRGWDWFTPRAIRHLPWREQERLIHEAAEIVRRHPRYWLMRRLLPFLAALAMVAAAVVQLFKMPLFRFLLLELIFLICISIFLVSIVTGFVWHRGRFQAALRQTLLDAGIRPTFCFECGYNLEGYEGNECPACDALLLRQADSSSEGS